MKTGIYITNTERNTGRSLVTLGIFKLLLSKVSRVGYFRPIINDQPQGQRDNHIETMLEHFNLDVEYKETYGFTMSQVVKYMNLGQEARLIEKIIEQYKALEERYDFIVVEGADFADKGVAIEFELDIEIAKNLALPTILVSSAKDQTIKDAASNVDLAVKTCAELDVNVHSVFMNRVPEDKMEEMREELVGVIPAETTIEIVPEIQELGSPTVREIQEELNGTVLLGGDLLYKQVDRIDVGAMQLRNFLERLGDNSLIITPGDRSDIILGALQANVSANYPSVSGIVVTGGLPPRKAIMNLIEGLPSVVPIIVVEDVTFDAANKVAHVKPKIRPGITRKIELSISTFEKYVDTEFLIERFRSYHTDVVTPHMFQYSLVAKAKAKKKHIVLPEGTDKRILLAASSLVAQNVVDVTLLGKRDEILAKAAEVGIQLSDKINII